LKASRARLEILPSCKHCATPRSNGTQKPGGRTAGGRPGTVRNTGTASAFGVQRAQSMARFAFACGGVGGCEWDRPRSAESLPCEPAPTVAIRRARADARRQCWPRARCPACWYRDGRLLQAALLMKSEPPGAKRFVPAAGHASGFRAFRSNQDHEPPSAFAGAGADVKPNSTRGRHAQRRSAYNRRFARLGRFCQEMS